VARKSEALAFYPRGTSQAAPDHLKPMAGLIAGEQRFFEGAVSLEW